MTLKSALAAAFLVTGSVAPAATLELTPSAQGTVGVTYERYGLEYECGGEAPFSVPGGSGSLGFDGSAPNEGRYNAEFVLPPQALRGPATAALSFTIGRGDGSSDFLPLCVRGYKGNGAITQADFVTGGTRLGGVAFFFESDESERQVSIDISSYLANFRPGREANILGLQLAIAHHDATYDVSDVLLTISSARVPEPLSPAGIGGPGPGRCSSSRPIGAGKRLIYQIRAAQSVQVPAKTSVEPLPQRQHVSGSIAGRCEAGAGAITPRRRSAKVQFGQARRASLSIIIPSSEPRSRDVLRPSEARQA